MQVPSILDSLSFLLRITPEHVSAVAPIESAGRCRHLWRVTDRAALQQLGVSHHQADIATRERLAATVAGLAHLARSHGLPHITLATCNRVELYWLGTLPLDDHHPALREEQFRFRTGLEALQHLIGVAAGRDSQIMGEAEILGQVRRAWALGREAGTTSPKLDARIRRALAAARRIRREFPLAGHARSVADASIHLALRHLEAPAPSVVVLGAGEAAVGAIRALQGQRPGARIVAVARRVDRAERVALATGTSAAPWDRVEALLAEADLVVAATAAPVAILTDAMVAAADRPLVLVDLGAPRNVDPAVRRRPGVVLFDLDDLRAAACPAPAAAADDLMMQIDGRIDREARAIENARLSPLLASMHAEADRLAAAEADALIDALGVSDLAARELVRRATRRLVRRALFPASRTLRAASPATVSAELATD